MAATSGGGQPPSYRDITSGDQTQRTSYSASSQQRSAPVLGAEWQAKMKGQCLPRAVKKPRFVIPATKLDEYRGYMKNHALICKFIGIWPSEKDLWKWIQSKWQPKGHIDLKLGAKGFFTVIFSNLQDKERILREDPIFIAMQGSFSDNGRNVITLKKSNFWLLQYGFGSLGYQWIFGTLKFWKE